MQPKVVGTAPAQGARAVLCRMVFGKDEVEFAIVDLHCWVLDQRGQWIAYVYDAELGEPVSLEYFAETYSLCSAHGILESKASVLSNADMDRLEVIVRRKEAKLEARIASPEMKLYRDKIRARLQNTQLSA
jgi:hypothetical protein